jgi:hypothetical protein
LNALLEDGLAPGVHIVLEEFVIPIVVKNLLGE